MLSGELVTKLTGRYLEFEMFPLTFDEYEDMKAFYGKHIDSDREQELRNYVLESGFPKTVHIDGLAEKRTYVQGIVREIFDKDIRKRVKVRKKGMILSLSANTLSIILVRQPASTICAKSLTKMGTALREPQSRDIFRR